MKMRKSEVLSDKELEVNLKSWQGLERDARVRKQEKKVANCNHTIAEIKAELESRQQSA